MDLSLVVELERIPDGERKTEEELWERFEREHPELLGAAFDVLGGEQRGYDGAKKIDGRKRHLLGDTERFVLEAKVHSAKVMDYEGIKELLQHADEKFPRLKHLWLDAGYRGEDEGKGWVEKTLGRSVELVERPR